MEKQAYYFARIEVAVEGLRAGVKHPALHELLDIVDEARYCLEGLAVPQPMERNAAAGEAGDTYVRVLDPQTGKYRAVRPTSAAPTMPTGETVPGKRRGRPAKTAGPYSAASKKQERAERALIADLQEVIDRAGCTNIPDAVAELLQCDVQPGVIPCLIDCTLEEFAALRDGKADADLAGKFLAVFKLKSEKEA